MTVKRLVLNEYVRVRRTRPTEHQIYTDMLRRDRLVVEDPQHTVVHELYRDPNAGPSTKPSHSATGAGRVAEEGAS